MSRAYPTLSQKPEHHFVFPWGREVLADYLDPVSPWLLDKAALAPGLFSEVTGHELTAVNLANFSRELQHLHEQQHNLDPYDWERLMLMVTINGISISYNVGKGLNFAEVFEKALGVDLLIVHEPYQVSFEGAPFPDYGLEHIAPAACLLGESRCYVETINPRDLPLCALHVRRGDYSIWEGGRFFFDDHFWLELCRRLMGEGFQVCIFTNDQEGALCEALISLGAHVSQGSASQDFCRMLHVDKIIGPPSTFPIMARSLAKACLNRSIVYETLQPIKKNS